MDASVLRHNEDNDDLLVSIGMAVGMHVVLLIILVVAGLWQPPRQTVSAAGPPIEAALMISTADIAVAQETAESAPKPTPEAMSPPPQPEPVPKPQDEPEPQQVAPQEQLPDPDVVNQEEVARLAALAAEHEREIQEQRRVQEQVDLTERIRQEQIEQRRQQREQQQAELTRQLEEAARRTKMEEDRLAQIAARANPAPAPREQPSPRPSQEPPATAGGNNGVDTGLEAKYVLAMHNLARRNWNRSLAPEATPCKVRFTQIIGGKVTGVQFLSCPFDAQARDAVERALLIDNMPYEGFEPVFRRQIDLTFCYPEEACPR